MAKRKNSSGRKRSPLLFGITFRAVLIVAAAAMFLLSENAGFITGENICIDGGMTRQMIYHADQGWMLTL